MANFLITDDAVTIEMSGGERFEAAHGNQVGSFHGDGHVTFAVCHGHNPGIVIDLANSKYGTVVLTVEHPEEIGPPGRAAELVAPTPSDVISAIFA